MYCYSIDSSLEESNGQNEGTPSDNVNASTYDYSTYYQYYQYYYGAHQQQSTSTTTQSDTTDGNDVEKTNEKVDVSQRYFIMYYDINTLAGILIYNRMMYIYHHFRLITLQAPTIQQQVMMQPHIMIIMLIGRITTLL